MAENLKFLYFGNKKLNNKEGAQKEEEENIENAEKLVQDRERLKQERIKILTEEAKSIYNKSKSAIGTSREHFIQKYVVDHMMGRSI